MKAAETFYATVDEEQITGWVAQTGKTTWRAWATFRGKMIEETGRSKQNAVDSWKAAANYYANQ